MPNTPAQFPNYDLPGAEWFSLAPNANIAIQGRRRRTASQLIQGADAFASVAAQLETNFTATSGVFVHRAQLTLFNLPTSGVVTVFAGLTTSGLPALAFTPLIPPAMPCQNTINAPVVAVLERDLLVTSKDLVPADTFGSPPASALIFSALVQFQGVSPTTYVDMMIVYTRLDGFTE